MSDVSASHHTVQNPVPETLPVDHKATVITTVVDPPSLLNLPRMTLVGLVSDLATPEALSLKTVSTPTSPPPLRPRLLTFIAAPPGSCYQYHTA